TCCPYFKKFTITIYRNVPQYKQCILLINVDTIRESFLKYQQPVNYVLDYYQ
ncbi:unnamed protein product, partial [Rotaria sp. Silwood2]